MLNLSVLLEDSVIKYGEKPAFSFANSSYTFAEVNASANKLANALVQLGLLPGQKVALSSPNCIWFPIVYYAVLKTGGIVVPLNILLKADEIQYHLQDCDAMFYFCFESTVETPAGEYGFKAFQNTQNCKHFISIGGNRPARENIHKIEDLLSGQSSSFDTFATTEDDTAVIIYTSGTTGKPKGAELSHSNLLCNAVICSDLFAVTETDIQLVVLPLFHVFGMTVLLNCGLYKAAHSILIPKFNSIEVIDAIARFKVSLFAGVPTMYWSLLNTIHPTISDHEISKNLRLCISGGASLPLEILHGFETRFGVEILEGYGMSEGSPVVSFNDRRIGRKPGSIGTQVWGVLVKVIDQYGNEVSAGERGELIYKGHNVMKGDYRKPEETMAVLKNGWLHSGDVAIKDGDGFLFIVDRIKDIIIRGGMNVYPREVEEILMKHPAISICAVIGEPNAKLGEEVKAFVVCKEKQQITEAELIAWSKEHMAAYKYPRKIEFKTDLPMTATGKILKKELKNNEN